MSSAAVVIGRNEGERLERCLASLLGFSPVVYVDSGSTDGSVALAQSKGADIVVLDEATVFTAARARNAGLARLEDIAPDGTFVQMIDGDCELSETWGTVAEAALLADDQLAVVCGRRREKHPEASVWNRLIDAEWDTQIGDAKACGGDALMRRSALSAVQGYRGDLIAGEEPELCFRLRRAGWKILRIQAEMTAHDAAMTRFSQWWQRSRRAGFAYANGAALHGTSPERFRVAETRRAVLWGAALPLVGVLGGLVFPWLGLLLLAFPAQVLRLQRRGLDWVAATAMTVGKFPEAQGVVGFYWGYLTGRRRGLIEYK